MQRTRGTETAQRQSSRVRQPLGTSSSKSDPLNRRSTTGRSTKVAGDRQSPRGPQSSCGSADSVNQKKLGTRISDLESQLGQAQEELKVLKQQLASTESAAKQDAQNQKHVEIKKTKKRTSEDSKIHNENVGVGEACDDGQGETDVFEVEKRTVETENVLSDTVEKDSELCTENVSNKQVPVSEMKKPSLDELVLKDNEINRLKALLEDKEKELEVIGKNNELLNSQLTEVNSSLTSSKAKEEELSSRLTHLKDELEANRTTIGQLSEKIKYVEGVKVGLESEMRMMRVQTEQWKKAADAAAAVLSSGEVNMNGRVPVRCGSMDKHFVETPYASYSMGSPGDCDDDHDGFGNGKRRGTGIKMLGELWKKKGQR